MTDSPIPMRLCCEGCGKLHIDEGEFATKPHHTHSCQHCGLTWRPAVVCTVGVQFLPGFKNDSPATSVIIGLGHIGPIEIGSSWKRKGTGALARVKEFGSYATGERKIVLNNGESHNERYLREHFIALGMIESPFKIHDYVRCKADGRIGRVYQVDGKGDLGCPDGERVFVQAIDSRAVNSGWLSMWFKPEEIEAWRPQCDERVMIRAAPTPGQVGRVALAVGQITENKFDLRTKSGANLGHWHVNLIEPAPPLMSLCCVVEGEEVFVDVEGRDVLSWVRFRALTRRKNTGSSEDFAKTCEIRDVHGVWIDPVLEVKDLESLQGTERPTLYINPPVGHGG